MILEWRKVFFRFNAYEIDPPYQRYLLTHASAAVLIDLTKMIKSVPADFNITSLRKLYNEFENNLIIEDFAERKRSEPHSRIYHLTATFESSWFQRRQWAGKTGIVRHKTIAKFAPELFRLFRRWWIFGLKSYFPHFHRPSKIPAQPVCHAFIDDRDHHEPYPHIHAVCWVPAKLVAGFERWAARARHDVEGAIQIDVRSADDTPAHTANVVPYASKYHSRWALHDDAQQLRATYPDVKAPSLIADRRPAPRQLRPEIELSSSQLGSA